VPGFASTRDFLAALSGRAPLAKAAGWDPVGLQLGDPAAPLARVAVCHDVTDPVIDALEREPVDLLLAYHPLLFRPLRALVAGPDPGGRAWRLARSGTGLAVVHTAFDVAPGGAADALAEALDLTAIAGFAPLHGPKTVKVVTFLPAEAADPLLDAVSAAGAARIGNYSHCAYRSEGVGSFFAGSGARPAVGRSGALNREPEVRIEFVAPLDREDAVLAALVAAHPYEEPAYDVYDRRGDASLLGRVGTAPGGTTLASLAARAAAALAGPAPRLAGDPAAVVERVAVVPGSGGELLAQARAAGADVLLTGDCSHHVARRAGESGLALVDPGHAATERPGLARLLDWVTELGVETRSLLGVDPDPWRS
jgi:dinuclear metal center YbgI/SA1388 family protein